MSSLSLSTTDSHIAPKAHKLMSDSTVYRPITSELTRNESQSLQAIPQGLPDAASDDAYTKHEIDRMTWLFIGKLINARLLDLPNLQHRESFGRFDCAFRVIASCVAEEFYT